MIISKNRVIGAVADIIYQMHPYNEPEGINIIINKINEHYANLDDGKGKNFTNKFIDYKDYEDFENKLKKLLFSIDEFTQLNISKYLKDNGVKDYKDQRNKGIKIVDRYSAETIDTRYYDFIDLDACLRNIILKIITDIEYNDDCFLCKYAKEYGSMEPGYDICLTCICNPKITYKREPHPMSLKPHNQWTEEEKKLYKL